jgi:hypothetical protein
MAVSATVHSAMTGGIQHYSAGTAYCVQMIKARSSLNAWEVLFGAVLADPAGDGVACRKARHKDFGEQADWPSEIRFCKSMGNWKMRGVSPS